MRHLRMVGLALVAVFAMAAVVATSALALPEFGKCEVQAKHEGKYANNNCTTKAKVVNTKPTGEFEWTPMTKVKNSNTNKEFSSLHGNLESELEPATLTTSFRYCSPSEEKLAKCRAGETEEHTGTIKVECIDSLVRGTFSAKSAKEVLNITVKYYGCKSLGFPCGNGSTTGQIETDKLKGALGYINKSTKEVGVDIKPQSGKEFAKFQCGNALQIIVGEGTEAEGPAYPPKGGGDGVIGVVTPVNSMVNEITTAFTANEATSENIPSKLEGKSIQVLEDYANNLTRPGHATLWSPAGQTQTAHLRSGVLCTIEAECTAEVKA
jgi:hypothetical protein